MDGHKSVIPVKRSRESMSSSGANEEDIKRRRLERAEEIALEMCRQIKSQRDLNEILDVILDSFQDSLLVTLVPSSRLDANKNYTKDQARRLIGETASEFEDPVEWLCQRLSMFFGKTLVSIEAKEIPIQILNPLVARLPRELVMIILSYLDRSTLKSMTRVDKSLKQIVQPFLDLPDANAALLKRMLFHTIVLGERWSLLLVKRRSPSSSISTTTTTTTNNSAAATVVSTLPSLEWDLSNLHKYPMSKQNDNSANNPNGEGIMKYINSPIRFTLHAFRESIEVDGQNLHLCVSRSSSSTKDKLTDRIDKYMERNQSRRALPSLSFFESIIHLRGISNRTQVNSSLSNYLYGFLDFAKELENEYDLIAISDQFFENALDIDNVKKHCSLDQEKLIQMSSFFRYAPTRPFFFEHQDLFARACQNVIEVRQAIAPCVYTVKSPTCYLVRDDLEAARTDKKKIYEKILIDQNITIVQSTTTTASISSTTAIVPFTVSLLCIDLTKFLKSYNEQLYKLAKTNFVPKEDLPVNQSIQSTRVNDSNLILSPLDHPYSTGIVNATSKMLSVALGSNKNALAIGAIIKHVYVESTTPSRIDEIMDEFPSSSSESDDEDTQISYTQEDDLNSDSN